MDTAVADRTEAIVQGVREDMNRLRGRLFQTLEAVGLPEKQEEAAKALVRRLTYDMQTSLESRLRGG